MAEASPTVPSYELAERLGAGGFGEVFAARHTAIKRDAAVKILHAKYSADAGAIARFTAEARAVSMISHPGIVELFEFGVLDDGRHYFVMERLRGRTLRDLLREHTRLPLAEALPILRGIADAVDAAHAAGIAHRDLKPDNVFLLPDGSVKLIDFGLAKLTTESDTPVTETGSVFGTPLYMSPEQCRGRAPDIRTDAYSFGALAYHLVAGSPPFSGEPIELALHHLNDAPKPPSSKCPELPRRVDTAILALLSKDPADRPMPLAAVVSAIAGERTLRRRRKLGRWLAAAAIAAGIGSAIAFVATREASTENAPELCTPSTQMLVGVWDPVRRTATEKRFDVQKRGVKQTWKVVSTALDAQFAEWSTRWDTACGSQERGTDPLRYAQRITCLERYFYVLRGHADSFASAEPSEYASTFGGAGWVPISDCDIDGVLRAEPAQAAFDKRERVAGIMRTIYDHHEPGSDSETRFQAEIAGTKSTAEALEELGSPMAAIAWEVLANITIGHGAFKTMEEVRALIRRATMVAEKHRFDWELISIELTRALAELERGDLAEARAAVAHAEQLALRLGKPFMYAHVQYYLARLALRDGHPEKALELLRLFTLTKERGPMPISVFDYRVSVVDAYLVDGRAADALREAKELVEFTRRTIGDHAIMDYPTTVAVHAALCAGDLDAATKVLDSVEAGPLVTLRAHLRAAIALRGGDRATAQARVAEIATPAKDMLAELASIAPASPDLTIMVADRIEALRGRSNEVDDTRAIAAYQLGDLQRMVAAVERVATAPIDSQPSALFAAPWIKAIAEARAGHPAIAERLVRELAYVHDREPQVAIFGFALDARVYAAFGRWKEAAGSAREAQTLRARRGVRDVARGETAMLLGAVLVEQGELSAAREALEEALDVDGHLASVPMYWLPFAQFALARALWPDEAARARAKRLAVAALAGFTQLGKFREPQRQAVNAWLADPTKPIAIAMVP